MQPPPESVAPEPFDPPLADDELAPPELPIVPPEPLLPPVDVVPPDATAPPLDAGEPTDADAPPDPETTEPPEPVAPPSTRMLPLPMLDIAASVASMVAAVSVARMGLLI